MATNTTTIKFVGQFDSSGITKGLQEIKKQITSSNISEELKKQLQDSFSKVEVNLPKLDKFMKKEDFNLKELNEYQKLVQEITKDMTNFSKIANEADFTKNFSEQDTARLKKFDEQIRQVDEKLKATKKEIINTFSNTDKGKINGKSNNSLNGVIEQLLDVSPDQIENKLNEIVKEAEIQTKNAQEKLSEIFSNSNKVKTEKEIVDFLYGENSGVSIKHGEVTRIKDQLNGIREGFLSFNENTPIEDVKAHIQSFLELINDPAFQNTEGKKTFLSDFIPEEVLERLREFQNDIPELKELLGEKQLKLLADGEAEKIRLTQQQAEELKKTIESLAEEGQITRTEADNLIKKLTGLSGAINDNTDAAKNLENQQKILSDTFGSLANRITNSISALTVFNKSIQIIHKAIASVRELDAAFTQIAIVSEQSNEQAWQMFDSFNKLAKQYSITTKDLTEGAKLFYQQGLNAVDTMKMVEASTVSAALGEVTMTEAANTLTAAIQGYNESAAVAMDYTDKIAMVGAVSAADFNELSAAMEKTASSAYTAGIDFDHLLGYLGKMIEVTREAPANLGTAMKTIIARFEDMKKDPNALIDGASANKVEAALATIGIALRDAAGEFRPLQDVFDELGAKWQSLTRNQQAYIATVAAGSRQQSRFLAMMNNYGRTLELISESQNSAGAAAKQYATYQDSAAAATARLTAAWEEFYTKIVNSEQIIWVLDRLKDLVEVMTKVGPVVSAIGASLAALGGQAILKGLLPSIGKSLATAVTTGKAFTVSLAGIKAGAGALILTLGKFVAIGALVVGAIAGIIWGIKQLDKHINKEKYEIKELVDDIKDLNQSIGKSSEKVNSLEKLMDRYEELNGKIYRTKEEQEELNNVIEKINGISKRAIISIGKNGEAHLHNAESIRKEIEAEKELIEFNANKKYNKVQNLLGKDSLTAEQAREANLNEYANALENYEDEDAKRYKKLLEIQETKTSSTKWTYGDYGKNRSKFDLYKEDVEISDYFKELTEDGRLEKFLKENFSSGRTYEGIKNLSDYENFLMNNSKMNGMSLEERYEEGIKLLQQFFEEQIDEEFKEAVKIIKDTDYLPKEKEKQQNIALQEYFSELSVYDESASAFFALMSDGLKFSGEQLDEVKNNYKNYYENNKDAIDEYLKSDRKQEDIDKLVEALKQTEGTITDGLINYAKEAEEEAKEALQRRNNQRRQFWRDNAKYLNPEERKQITNSENFVGFATNDKVSSQDLDYLSNFFKMDLQEGSKVSLFDFIVKDEDDKFQTLMQKYMNSLSNGITEESDKLEEQIIQVLTPYIPEEDIQKIINDFIPNYKEFLEQKIDEDFSNYNTTRKGAADLTKLKSKERKQFLADNEDASKYFEYNEDGEEYLNILGKIVLLEQQRSQISKDINNEISANKIQISDNDKQLQEINEKLRTSLYTNEETEDSLKSQKNFLENNNEKLEEANKLYQKQLDYINESTNLQEYEAMALQSNVNEAKKHADNIKAIAEAWAEYQQGTAGSNLEAISTLNQLDASYQSLFMTVSKTGEEVFTLNQDIVDKMIANEQNEYQEWRKKEVQKLEDEKTLLEMRVETLQNWLDTGQWVYNEDAANKIQSAQDGAEGEADAETKGQQKGLENAVTFYQKMEEIAQEYFTDIKTWAENVYTNIMNPENIELAASTIKLPPLDVDASIDFKDFDKDDNSDTNKNLAKKLIEQYKQRIAIITATIAKLGDLSPEFQKTYDKALKDAAKGGQKAVKDLNKAIESTVKAIKDLDDLLRDIKRDFKDISVDYNPFMDLFEAWEHEWDYYYNIKQLIAQLGQQGQWIDNIISSDYASAEDKLAAYEAKIGNLTAKMAANDAYILTLRQGIVQKGLELEEKYGQYYNISDIMGSWQIYQKDTQLHEWDDLGNAIQRVSFELNQLINTQENKINLAEATQETLEQERSAYESILSTVDSLIDSLENEENITVDLTDLKDVKAELELAVKEESVEEIKAKIRDLNDELQELQWKLDLNENVKLNGFNKSLEDMEEIRDILQEYIDQTNEAITNQQEYVQDLTEVYKDYIEVAISTEQELYDAIVENYRNEIDQKKKQYDYLKQLDNDYLNTIKNNISKERQAREDVNKQKSYQQNLQRAQLLQMDTSGAYRTELANLNKEIEGQRQDLYDDLVDKQVEALEKEIEKRHELYDMEVAALEERLAYMQENAVLLWEMVNEIVASGSDEMMATLENTIEYVNSSELARERQRNQWEFSTQFTYKGIINKEIDSLNAKIQKETEYLKGLNELKAALEKSIGTYQQSTTILIDENANFQSAMDAYMQTWTDMTNGMTGYYSNWQTTVNAIKTAIEKDIKELEALGEEGGGIEELNQKLTQSADDMYNSFIEERKSYKDQLTKLIGKIETEISAAIKKAANAITNAANNIKVNPSGSTNPGSGTNPGGTNPGDGGIGKYKGWKASFSYNNDGHVTSISRNLGSGKTEAELYNDWVNYLNNLRTKFPNVTSWGLSYYKAGGLANFTGPAWLDGTPSKPEAVLNPRQTKLFESMVSSLEQASNNSNINSVLGSSYNIGDINTSINVAKLDNQTDIDKVAKAVEDKIVKTIRNRVSVSINKGV